MSMESNFEHENGLTEQGTIISEDNGLNRDFQMSDLINLFFKPSKFATSGLNFVKGNYIFILMVIVGVGIASNRVERQVLKYGERIINNEILLNLMNNWAYFWIYVAAFGVISGVAMYWIWGSWYSLRIKWSGHNVDKKEGRALYMWTYAMGMTPYILTMIVSTFMYKNFIEYFDGDSTISTILLIFPLWKCICDYKMLRARYNLKKWPARIWFLILPSILIFVGFVLSVLALLLMEM